jgi:putative ABC transport system permease protein
MYRIALAMLFRDKAKFFGIVMGVTLASLVITQQGAIFVGLMARTFAAISDMGDPDIWVMDPKVQFIDDIKPLQDTSLYRVRGIEGVAFAAPLYKGLIRARLDNGQFQNCIVVGLDDSTLTGGPPTLLQGRLEDLRQADAVIVDVIGAKEKLNHPNPDPKGKPLPLAVGDTMELNDRRGVVVGISDNTRTFQSQPIIYTTYSRAKEYAPPERKLLSFILVKTKAGQSHSEVAKRIEEVTGLAAYTREQFKANTVAYYIRNTGIPINFGIAVSLGFIIGTVITGFMFFSFTLDNLRYFGTLKAMGAQDRMLLRMIVLQALVVGTIGFGIGVGGASLFGKISKHSPLAFLMPWQLLFLSGAAVMIICMLSAMLSMQKVFKLEPAVVFKG